MWIFLHIPKTAGVAIREILSAKYNKNEVMHVEDPNRFTLSAEEEKNTKLIHGHFDFSFTESLTSTNKKIFTFLRDPLERSISEYFFVRNGNYNLSSLPPEQAGIIKKIKSLNLNEFLLSEERGVRGRVQNNQLFFLSGDVFNATPTIEQRYETACRNLDNFHYIGIVEEMNKSLQLLSYKASAPPTKSVIRNSTNRHDHHVSDALRSEFTERNKYEYMIYEYAKNKMYSAYEEAFRGMLQERFISALEQLPETQELHYTFDQPLSGDGWHTREGSASQYWRFTGPDSTATLYFGKLTAPQRLISFTVFHAVTPEHLTSMRVSYNGIPLQLVQQDGQEFRYHIPEQALTARNHTSIEISTITSCKPVENDNRLLGIAFTAVSVT